MLNFKTKPIIGMIHLSQNTGGSGWEDFDVIDRAMKEIQILQESGIQGVIIENYHSGVDEVLATCAEIDEGLSLGHIDPDLNIGINILPNDYREAFKLAYQYGFQFIQMDFVSGKYERAQEIDEEEFQSYRSKYPNIQVLGGVWPKYYNPVKSSSLESDLKVAMTRCDAIVVTGAGTGKSTPMDKIKMFRDIIGDFPLIIGAGVTADTAEEQLEIGDGAIVGSAFKMGGNTNNQIDKKLVKKFMDNVN